MFIDWVSFTYSHSLTWIICFKISRDFIQIVIIYFFTEKSNFIYLFLRIFKKGYLIMRLRTRTTCLLYAYRCKTEQKRWKWTEQRKKSVLIRFFLDKIYIFAFWLFVSVWARLNENTLQTNANILISYAHILLLILYSYLFIRIWELNDKQNQQ
jgi:hypothetical protein